MKYLLLAMACLIPLNFAYPTERRIKVGYAHSLCKYVNDGYDIAVSFEERYKQLAGELEFGWESHRIKQIGYLNTFKISLFGKVYITPTIWIGAGGELANNFVRETNSYYKREIRFKEYAAYVDNEWRYGVSVGKDWESWFVEVRSMFGDLDLESSLPYETEIEKDSKLDCIIFRIGRKW